MRSLLAASVLVALAAAVFADDKVGKTPAPAILTKSVQDLRKIAGYHFKYNGSIGEQSLETTGISWLSGLIKQTTANATDIWRKDKAAFAKDKGGKYVGASSLGQQEQAIVNSPTPDALLGEMLGLANVAKFIQDESVDDKECKVIECQAPEQKLKDYVESVAARASALEDA